MSNLSLLINDTIKKEIRNKALVIIFFLNIVIFSLITMGVDFVISFVGNEGVPLDLESQKIYVFLFFINKWTGLLAILFGINCVKSDEEENLLGQIISLPIKRGEYLLGRIIGTTLIVFGFYLILSLCGGITLAVSGAGWPFSWGFLLAAPVKLLYCASIILLSVLVSMFTSKVISFLIMMINFTLIDVSGAINSGKTFSQIISDLTVFKAFNLSIYSIFPHLSELDKFISDLIFSTTEVTSPLFEIGHGLISLTVLFFLLFLFFRKKEL